ncbi:MAG TPA: DNA repair protein RecO [Sedimentisphaerales bacterium]|nr:DNA repair protein RecO [Sedimentisphaerales bacterium]
MLTKDEAICIRALDYSETSQVVTFFTRAAGKVSTIAKGAKRPKSAFDGPIEALAHGKIVFSDSTREKLATLTEFEQQPGFGSLSNNLFVFNCCLFAAELLNSLTDDYDPHAALFDNFLHFLQSVKDIPAEGGASRDTLALLILFQLSLLKEIGLQPILNGCANCKTRYEMGDTTYKFYFSSSANGLICGDCEASFPDRISLTKRTVNCLSNLRLIAESEEKTLNEIERALVHHFTELLHRPPKMAKYVLKG